MSEEAASADKTGGYLPPRPVIDRVRQMELQHGTLRLHMWLQYGVLTLSLGGIVFLAYLGKLDATVSALLAALLGYVLRSTQDKRPAD